MIVRWRPVKSWVRVTVRKTREHISGRERGSDYSPLTMGHDPGQRRTEERSWSGRYWATGQDNTGKCVYDILLLASQSIVMRITKLYFFSLILIK